MVPPIGTGHMTSLHQSRELAEAAAEKLRVFAQPQRLMILSCLLGGERQVAEIERLTGVSQPALSQQLAELRRASLVMTRRDAKLVFYSLADGDVRTCVATMEHMLAGADGPAPISQATPPSIRRPIAIARGRSDPSFGAAAFARIG